MVAQGGLQRRHGGTDLGGIACCVGSFQSLGGLHDGLVMGAAGGLGFFAFGALAAKGFVQRFAEGVPEFLFVAALQRHGLRFGLPALLQRFDGIHAQGGGSGQLSRFFNERLAAFGALLLRGLQPGGGGGQGGFPLCLQFRKGFFGEVARVAPAVGELVELAVDGFPVRLGLALQGGGPGFGFFNEAQAGGFVGGAFFAGFFQPLFNELVGLVAGVVKALPEGVIGGAALVGGFPFFAQFAQGFLQFAAREGGGQGFFGGRRLRGRSDGHGGGAGGGFRRAGGRIGGQRAAFAGLGGFGRRSGW